jgi:nitrate reductase (NAD(P)H)
MAASAAGDAAEKTWPTVTLAELATHNTLKSCWIAVNGGVYDATPFLDDHPGGPEQIMSHAGKDATRDWLAIHSGSAKKQLAGMRVGTLPDGVGERVAEGKEGGCSIV